MLWNYISFISTVIVEARKEESKNHVSMNYNCMKNNILQEWLKDERILTGELGIHHFLERENLRICYFFHDSTWKKNLETFYPENYKLYSYV